MTIEPTAAPSTWGVERAKLDANFTEIKTHRIYRAKSILDQSISDAAAGTVVQFQQQDVNIGGFIYESGAIRMPEISASWSFVMDIALGVVSGNSHSVEAWLETDAADVGGAYAFVPDSGRLFQYDQANTGHIIYSSSFDTSGIGAAFRLHVRDAGGNPELTSFDLTNGIRVPSAAMVVTQQGVRTD